MKQLLPAVSVLALASVSCGSIEPGGSTPTPDLQAALDRARAHFDAGRFVETLEETDAIRAADDELLAAQLLAADAHLELLVSGQRGAAFQLPEAIQRLERATEIAPDDSTIWLRLADARLKDSEFDAGLDAAQRALQLRIDGNAPRDELAEAALAVADNRMQVFVDARRPEIDAEARRPADETVELAAIALAAYEKARSLGANEGGTLGAANVHRWMHREGKALEILERGILDDPEAHELHGLFQQIYAQTGGDATTGLAAYERMLRAHEDDPALLFYLGRARLAHADTRASRGQWEQASEGYARAAAEFARCGSMRRDYRDNALANQGLCQLAIGRCAFERGDLDRAAQILDAAFELCPQLGDLDAGGQPTLRHTQHGSYLGNQFLIGQTLAEEVGLEAGLAHFERLIERHPGRYGFLYNNAALAARDLGVQVAEAADGDRAANLQRAMGLWERSYAHYRKAVELVPDDARTVNDCGLMLVYHLRRDYDEAARLFARAIELGQRDLDALPDDTPEATRHNAEEAVGDAYQNTGVLLELQSRPADEIRPWFENAVRYFPYERRDAAQKLRELSAGGAAARNAVLTQDPKVQDPRHKAFEKTAREATAKVEAEDWDSALLALDAVAKDMKGFAPFHRMFGHVSLGYARAMLAEGNQEVAGGLLEDATRHLSDAIRLDPKDNASRLDLAEAGLASGDFEKAYDAVRDLPSEALQDDRARTLRAKAGARVYVDAKTKNNSAQSADLDAALDTARQDFLRLEKDRALTSDERTLWIHAERWAGESKNAVGIVVRALEAAARNGETDAQNALLDQLVTLSFEVDETATAVQALEGRSDALGLWYSGRALYHHGLWHRRGGEFAKAKDAFVEAQAAFSKSQDQNPAWAADARAWTALCMGMEGLSSLNGGELEDARARLLEAARLNPASLTSPLGENKTIKLGLILVGDAYFQARQARRARGLLHRGRRRRAGRRRPREQRGPVLPRPRRRREPPRQRVRRQALLRGQLRCLLTRPGGRSQQRASAQRPRAAAHLPPQARRGHGALPARIRDFRRRGTSRRRSPGRRDRPAQPAGSGRRLLGKPRRLLAGLRERRREGQGRVPEEPDLLPVPASCRHALPAAARAGRPMSAPRRALWALPLVLASCAVGQQNSQPTEAAAPTPTPTESVDAILARASELTAQAAYNDALDLLDEARRAHPEDLRLVVALAKAFHVKADAQVAEGAFDLHTQFHYEDVIRTAGSVLEKRPEHLEARLLAASAHYQLGRLDRALEDAQKAVATAPDDYSAQAMLGRIQLQRYIQATQSLRADQPAQDVLAAREQTRVELGRAAREALESARRADPTRSFPSIKLGDLSAWSGDLPAALPHYRDGLALEPEATLDHEWLRSAVSPSTELAQLYESALASYTARDDSRPEQAALLHWYAARARFDAQQWDPAARGFESALGARPDLVSSHRFLLLAAYEQGDEKTAARHALSYALAAPREFADRIRGDEYTTTILRGMAQRAFERGRVTECREINHVLALAAHSVDAWNNYALLCRETGKYRESLAAYERALELEQSPQLLNDAAVILQYHLATPENLETARGFYERAIERAEWMLVNESLEPAAEKRTRTALRDARANLRRLRR